MQSMHLLRIILIVTLSLQCFHSKLDLGVNVKLAKKKNLLCNFGSEPIVGLIQSHLYKQRRDYINAKYLYCCYIPIEWESTHILERRKCIGFEDSVDVEYDAFKVRCTINGSAVFEDYFLKSFNTEYSSKKNKVAVIVLSNLSRGRMHRVMPKTINFLRNYIMAKEYKRFQGHSLSNDDNLWKHLFVEDLWNSYETADYRVGYAEDCAKKLVGFNFDYNFGPMYDFLASGYGHMGRRCPFCLGTVKTHKALLAYARKLINFPIPILSVTRINVLQQFQYGIEDLDMDFLEFFNSIFRRLSNDTVLVFMGDGNVRESLRNSDGSDQVGNLAPFLFVSMPGRKGRQLHPDNTDNMITYGDIYATLIDLLGPDASTYYAYNEHRSLFVSIPKNRTCPELNIDPAVCLK